MRDHWLALGCPDLSDSVLDQTFVKYWVKADTTMTDPVVQFLKAAALNSPPRLPLHSRKPMYPGTADANECMAPEPMVCESLTSVRIRVRTRCLFGADAASLAAHLSQPVNRYG